MESHNVILITIDSLRADALSKMSGLTSLEDEGFNFSTVYTNGPSTPFSFPSLFNTSYHPFHDEPKIKSPTIVERYRDEGYNTLAVVANNPYISSLSGYEKGFTHFEDYMSSLHGDGRSLPKRILDRSPKAIKNLKNVYKWYFKDDITSASGGTTAIEDAKNAIQGSSPFFLWLHLMDTHYPYTPPLEATDLSPFKIVKLNEFRKRYRLTDPGDRTQLTDLKKLYYDCVEWVDKLIMNFINFLKKEDLWRDTDLVITADHGEGFYEHGFLGHPAQLYQELVSVPLILKMAGMEHEVKENIGELRDIPKLLGSRLENDEGYPRLPKDKEIPMRASHAGDRSCMKGDVNLIGQPGKLEYDIFGLVSENYKLIYDGETGKLELYDLKKDPGERNDISKNNKEIIERLSKPEYPFP